MTKERVINKIDRKIGNQLRLRRQMMGLSQSQLANCVGITFQQIQKYEQGTNSISARRLYDLAQALEVCPLYFYEACGESSHVMPEDLSAQAVHLAQDYMGIPSLKVRKSIAAFVREVAKMHRTNMKASALRWAICCCFLPLIGIFNSG
jgi:transcriptional regulator with XRE-family HTH domain